LLALAAQVLQMLSVVMVLQVFMEWFLLAGVEVAAVVLKVMVIKGLLLEEQAEVLQLLLLVLVRQFLIRALLVVPLTQEVVQELDMLAEVRHIVVVPLVLLVALGYLAVVVDLET
jgi:hypothetical protein